MESSDYFGIVVSFNGSEQFELCVPFSNHSGLASKPAYISHTTLHAVREKNSCYRYEEHAGDALSHEFIFQFC